MFNDPRLKWAFLICAIIAANIPTAWIPSIYKQQKYAIASYCVALACFVKLHEEKK